MAQPDGDMARLLEAVASIMGLTDARLELVFEHGQLVRWFSHSERKQPRDPGEFDQQAAHLTGPPPRTSDAAVYGHQPDV